MLVSVIIPTYNRADTIERAVQSVLDQTYREMELIVVDDGSTDNTEDVLRPYSGKIILIKQDNAGPSAARNAGIAAAKGAAFAFLDSDDVWLPEKVELQVRNLLRGGTAVPCCICNASFSPPLDGFQTSFGISGITCREKEGIWINPADVLVTRFLLFNQVVLVRREAVAKAGGFNSRLRLLEDYDLALRLSLMGPWGLISEPLVLKDNSTRGLGVEAMAVKDQTFLIKSKIDLLESFLSNHLAQEGQLRSLVRRQVKALEAQCNALQLSNSESTISARLGGFLLLAQRLQYALLRRSPWWPRAKVKHS
jgi:glycosyltransferase involved in cell wall biosynthesis